MKLLVPSYAKSLFEQKRYKVLYGGRGSSKSHTVARMLLAKGKSQVIRCLCAREFQNSIKESVHKLLTDLIYEMGLQDHYSITQQTISGKNGSEFIFRGLHGSLMSIKSMEGITDLWLEEAQTVSQASWDVLVPTIRQEGSEIWATFNPENADDPTYVKFIDENGNPRENEDLICMRVNWMNNPWFPDVLEKEKNYLFEVNSDLALHVWEGYCRSNSDSQIFANKWIMKEFEVDPEWSGPYLGADWGFSVDPTVMVELYIDQKNMLLYVRREAHGYNVELDDIPELFDSIPVSRSVVSRGDNSRPETISHLSKKGFPIESCTKWKGSVEDGIEVLKNFRQIVVHIDCPEMAKECRLYSYKVDKLTGKVTTGIVDLNNHCFDAVRYALEDIIMSSGTGLLGIL